MSENFKLTRMYDANEAADKLRKLIVMGEESGEIVFREIGSRKKCMLAKKEGIGVSISANILKEGKTYFANVNLDLSIKEAYGQFGGRYYTKVYFMIEDDYLHLAGTTVDGVYELYCGKNVC